jgi:hypothetical protein
MGALPRQRQRQRTQGGGRPRWPATAGEVAALGSEAAASVPADASGFMLLTTRGAMLGSRHADPP